MITKNEMLFLFQKRYGHKLIPDIRKYPRRFLKDIPYYQYRKEIRAYRRISGHFPFPCKFKKNGKCNGLSDSMMCCCNACYSSHGYFDFVFEQDLWYYAQRFNRATGFWRKDKGCILGREYRSETCLSYYCKESKHKKFNEELYIYGRGLINLLQKVYKEIDKVKQEYEKYK